MEQCCGKWVDVEAVRSISTIKALAMLIGIFVVPAMMVLGFLLSAPYEETGPSLSWFASALLLCAGTIIFFVVLAAFVNNHRGFFTTLIGYDGWLWQSESGKTHLDTEPPQYRREPDGMLMSRGEHGWDRSHTVFSDEDRAKEVVSIGPIVPFGVGLLRRWRAWRNPKRYYMQYFNPPLTHVVRVSTDDGTIFRIDESGSQKPAIEGPPELIMSVLMRNMRQNDTQRMLREPERMEAWYAVITEATRALHDVLKDRDRVPKGKVPVGKIRLYLAEVDRVLRYENKGWQGVTPDAGEGPSLSFFEALLDEFFPRSEKDDPASRGVGQPETVAKAGEYS